MTNLQSPTTDDLVLGMDFKMIEGSLLERVARSYHTVQATAVEEQDAMSKYYAAVSQIESLKEAEGGAGNGIIFHLDPTSNSKVLMSSSIFLFLPSLFMSIPAHNCLRASLF